MNFLLEPLPNVVFHMKQINRDEFNGKLGRVNTLDKMLTQVFNNQVKTQGDNYSELLENRMAAAIGILTEVYGRAALNRDLSWVNPRIGVHLRTQITLAFYLTVHFVEVNVSFDGHPADTHNEILRQFMLAADASAGIGSATADPKTLKFPPSHAACMVAAFVMSSGVLLRDFIMALPETEKPANPFENPYENN